MDSPPPNPIATPFTRASHILTLLTSLTFITITLLTTLTTLQKPHSPYPPSRSTLLSLPTLLELLCFTFLWSHSLLLLTRLLHPLLHRTPREPWPQTDLDRQKQVRDLSASVVRLAKELKEEMEKQLRAAGEGLELAHGRSGERPEHTELREKLEQAFVHRRTRTKIPYFRGGMGGRLQALPAAG